MNIFLAYGYNPRDQWVRDMVKPIVEAFGSTPSTGEETYTGPNIPDSVLDKIRRADGLIGFTTRRTTQDNIVWQTHQWVVMELAAAIALHKRVVEVREVGVDPQGGLAQNLQRIDYVEGNRDQCLVDIVKAIGSWHQSDTVRLQLLPEGLVNAELRPILRDPGLSCKYVIRTGNFEQQPLQAQIWGFKGGLFIDVPNVPRNALIQISVAYGARTWSSDYESTDSYGVHLR
jgi:hypothetical protein